MNKTTRVRQVWPAGLEHGFLRMFEAEYEYDGESPGRTTGRWLFVSRKENPQFGPEPLQPDAVIIIPILKIKTPGKRRTTNKIALIREYRVPLGDYEYAFPAGLLKPNESVEDCARREVEEETGFQVKRILFSTQPLVSSAGLSDESVAMVFVEAEGEASNEKNEAVEDIHIELYDYDDMLDLLETRAKMSAKTWPVLFMFKCLGEIKIPSAVIGV